MDCFGIQCVRLDFEDDDDDGRKERHALCLARARELQSVHHPRLARVLHARVSGGYLVVGSEHARASLRALPPTPRREDEMKAAARAVFEALDHLASLGVAHLALCPDNVLLTTPGRFDSIVLAGWGLHHATDGGRLVAPPLFVGERHYAAPEVLEPGSVATSKAAVWSAGVILLEILTGKNPFADDGTVLASACKDADVIRGLLEVPELDRCSRELRELLMGCLNPSVVHRYDASSALYSPFCSSDGESSRLQYKAWPFLRADQFTAPSLQSLFPNASLPSGHSRAPSIDTLDGGQGKASPAVLPVRSEVLPSPAQLMEALLDRSSKLLPELPDPPGPASAPLLLGQPLRLKWDPRIVCVSKEEALERVRMAADAVVEENVFELFKGNPLQASLELRERDVVYQQRRVSKFLALLKVRDVKAVFAEAAQDVPPVIRAQVWAALLALPALPLVEKEWCALDVSVETPADHQIAVDVPRCNARHELIGTPEGRKRLTRVLKVCVFLCFFVLNHRDKGMGAF